MTNLFELEDVVFSHRKDLPPVLKNFSLTVEEGARTAVLGANGAGKTTLFYTLTGVNVPQSGQIIYKGTPLEYTKDGLRSLRSDVAVILQNPDEQIFCSLVEEDVAFGPLNLGLDREVVEQRVTKALRDVRMTGYERRPLQQLSGGQRKRVAIAGALAMDPKVMIMDEPTSGLDPQASMEVMELAEKLSLNGVTVLLSTHDIHLAYRWADVTNVLCEGRVEFKGDADEFYSDTETVYKCGLLTPSVFSMNRDVCAVKRIDPAPHPHNACEFLAKFGRNSKSGKLLLVPSEPEDAEGRFDTAVGDLKGTNKGVYGSDVRNALTDIDIEYRYDGMEGCFKDVVEGKDSILLYDPVYAPTMDRQIDRLKKFGFDIDCEVMR